MSSFVNRVRVLTATTGQGTVTLGAAYSTAFLSPTEAGMVDGETYRYAIEEGSDFEIGSGVYASAGGTLTRATVQKSKIAGTAGTTKLTLTGAATVRIIASAEDFSPLSALSYAASVLAVAAAVTFTSAAAAAFAVGPSGATNPALQVDGSVASAVTGVKITGRAAAAGASIEVLSSGTNENLTIDAKGSGVVRLGATSTGAIEFSRNAVPTASDGAALGTTALMWSDGFFASGAVLNFNNGNVTLTHSAGLLTLSGSLTVNSAVSMVSSTVNAEMSIYGSSASVGQSVGLVINSNSGGSVKVVHVTNDTGVLNFWTGGTTLNSFTGTTSRLTISTAGIVTVISTAAASSTAVGAFVVGGGIAAAGAGWFGGRLTAQVSGLQVLLTADGTNGIFMRAFGGSSHYNYQLSQQNTAAAFEIAASSAVGGTTFSNTWFTIAGASGTVSILASVASTSTTTGALTVGGGMGVVGNINCGGESITRTSNPIVRFVDTVTTTEIAMQKSSTYFDFVMSSAHEFRFYTSSVNRLLIGAGLYHTSATGGDKGAGTINFQAVYDDNVLLTDYVFNKFLGVAANDNWSERIRARYQELDATMFEVLVYSNFWRNNGRLYGMPDLDDCIDGKVKNHSLGAMSQMLWQTAELHAIHIASVDDEVTKLKARVTELEGRLAA